METKNRYAYKVKVYPHDWFVAICDVNRLGMDHSGMVFHNNITGVKSVFSVTDAVYCGWGSRFYDQIIIRAIVGGFSPEEIYDLHNFIRGGQQAWNYPKLKNIYFSFFDSDLSYDTSGTMSISTVAGHLGKDIPVYEIPDTDDRMLSEVDRRSISLTLGAETKAIAEVVNIRDPYLTVKETIGKMAGIGLKALEFTNAKLCSIYFGAKKKEYSDGRNYKYPDNLLREYIPQEMFDFVNLLYNKSMSDEEVFTKRSLTLMIGGCQLTIAGGGVHGAVANYDSNDLPEGRVILYLDVTGFYPSTIVLQGYVSRSVAPEKKGAYAGVVAQRKEAKVGGIVSVANALKLLVNTFYGAMLAQKNDLYDPLMGRSTVYTGQLFLIELLNHMATEINGLKVVMGNTDGFIVECDESSVPAVFDIVNEWQDRTGYQLERDDDIARIIQKNVNNYIEVKKDDSVKLVGELKRGVEQGSGFRCNNNAPIIPEAVVKYILEGVPVDDTIRACTDIKKFQYITNTGKARRCFTKENGEEKTLNLVNRAYATTDMSRDTLFIVDGKGSIRKVPGLPAHCVVDNKNELEIKDIDIEYYIREAAKLARSYTLKDVNLTIPLAEPVQTEEKGARRTRSSSGSSSENDAFWVACNQLTVKSYFERKGCTLIQDGGSGWYIVSDFGVDSVKINALSNTIKGFGTIPVQGSGVFSVAKIFREFKGEDVSFEAIKEELYSLYGKGWFTGEAPDPIGEGALLDEVSKEELDKLKGRPILPQRASDNREAIKYLCGERALDSDIVKYFMYERGDIYESVSYVGSNNREVHNIAFLGRDKEGNVRACESKYIKPYWTPKRDSHGNLIPEMVDGEIKRNEKGEIIYEQEYHKSNSVLHSDKCYSFSYIPEGADTIRCFEATIDALSWLSLLKREKRDDSWKTKAFVTLEGVRENWATIPNSLVRILNENPSIKRVLCLFDKDAAGLGAADNLVMMLTGIEEVPEDEYVTNEDGLPCNKYGWPILTKPYEAASVFPQPAYGKNCKDWNDVQVAVKQHDREVRQAKLRNAPSVNPAFTPAPAPALPDPTDSTSMDLFPELLENNGLPKKTEVNDGLEFPSDTHSR